MPLDLTTLTLHISRSISRQRNPGDTIVVTRLDLDANVTPGVLAAQDRRVSVRWVDFEVEDGILPLASSKSSHLMTLMA